MLFRGECSSGKTITPGPITWQQTPFTYSLYVYAKINAFQIIFRQLNLFNIWFWHSEYLIVSIKRTMLMLEIHVGDL